MIKLEGDGATSRGEAEEYDYFMKTDDGIEYAGKHLIVDFWGASSLDDCQIIEAAMREAASSSGATLLHVHLHKFTSGGGVTGVALLAESHISVHTWPERNFAAFDVFMCGRAKPEVAVEVLKKVFKPEQSQSKVLMRGEVNDLASRFA